MSQSAPRLHSHTYFPLHDPSQWLRVCQGQVWELLPNQMGPHVSHGKTRRDYVIQSVEISSFIKGWALRKYDQLWEWFSTPGLTINLGEFFLIKKFKSKRFPGCHCENQLLSCRKHKWNSCWIVRERNVILFWIWVHVIYILNLLISPFNLYSQLTVGFHGGTVGKWTTLQEPYHSLCHHF